MQPATPPSPDVCEIRIFPARDLSFNVRVSLAGKHYLKGGFHNPDMAQRHGLTVMLAMTGLQPEV